MKSYLQMFEQLLNLERNVQWTYGNVVCSTYPLAKIDTIDQETGKLNQDSALALVVYGVRFQIKIGSRVLPDKDRELHKLRTFLQRTVRHLDLLDNLMEDILEQKWQAFAKNR